MGTRPILRGTMLQRPPSRAPLPPHPGYEDRHETAASQPRFAALAYRGARACSPTSALSGTSTKSRGQGRRAQPDQGIEPR